jgi:uncharacterized protein with HEPN domain
MERSDPQRLRLEHILAAMSLISEFTQGKTFTEYSREAMTTSAVERQFITIGEAVNALSHIDPPVSSRIADYRGIIEFRNQLTHRYYTVDNVTVWRVVLEFLPVLRSEVETLLRE